MSSILFSNYTNTLFFHQISGIYPTRGKEFIKYWPQVFESEEDKARDKRWREKFLTNVFNAACKNIDASFLRVGDEFMSEICFWTTAKGNLPHLSYIFRNPEPLGTGSRHLPAMLQEPFY